MLNSRLSARLLGAFGMSKKALKSETPKKKESLLMSALYWEMECPKGHEVNIFSVKKPKESVLCEKCGDFNDI